MALANVVKQFILGITGNLELSKDFLDKRINFMSEENRGSKVLKRILNAKRCAEESSEYKIDLVAAINSFEDMFMPKADKDTLLIVLKSLLKGKVVSVKKKVKEIKTGAEIREHKS